MRTVRGSANRDLSGLVRSCRIECVASAYAYALTGILSRGLEAWALIRLELAAWRCNASWASLPADYAHSCSRDGSPKLMSANGQFCKVLEARISGSPAGA